MDSPEPRATPAINTGGGTYVAGNVSASEFVGRDKNVYNISDDASHYVHGLPNPYLGLRSFTYDDRAAFAGREREIEKTVSQLTDRPRGW